MGVKKSLLFGLTLLDQIVREFSDPIGVVSYSYENLYGFIKAKNKKKSLYNIKSQLRKDNVVCSLEKGRFVFTNEGKKKCLSEFPLLRFMNYSWDGKWRVVGFDIEEQRRVVRDRLRNFLKQYGFGMVQKSLYVSALPIENEVAQFFASQNQIFGNVYVFIADNFFFGDRDEFVIRAFSLDKVNEGYKQLLGKIKECILEKDRNKLVREFVEVSNRDPFLPRELLPKDFKRNEVWQILRENNVFD